MLVKLCESYLPWSCRVWAMLELNHVSLTLVMPCLGHARVKLCESYLPWSCRVLAMLELNHVSLTLVMSCLGHAS